jgi:hypothetical protein
MLTVSLKRCLALPAFAVMFSCALATVGKDEPRGELRKFMRQKLEHSKGVLEGLALEDFDMIARNADAMRTLGQDARWRVSPNLNYLRLSSEFQDLANELVRSARKRNLDGATLAYVDLTLNCVKCHKLVRDERLITFKVEER